MLTDKQYEEIEKRWENYKSGKSKSYTLEEAKKMLKREHRSLRKKRK
jgi:hypothetical protein